MVKPAENIETKQFQPWTEKEYYDKEIIPLLEELVAKCEAKKIPFLVHVISADDCEKSSCGTLMNTFMRDNTERMSLFGNILAGKVKAMPVPVNAESLAVAALLKTIFGKED